MMRLPFTGAKTKAPAKRQRMTFKDKKEREDHKREKKERDILHNEYVDLLVNDPELRKQTVAKTYGINLKTSDPVEKRRKEVQDMVTQLALDKLKDDPEFAERLVQAEADRLVGEGAGYIYGDDEDNGHYRHSPLGDLDEAFELVDKMKERFGTSERGTLDTILNSKLVEALGPLLTQLVLAQATQIPAPRQMGTAPPPRHAELHAPEEPRKPEAPPPPKSEEQIKFEQAPPEETTPDISGWLVYLEDVPEVFVSDLYKFAESGNILAQGLLEMLQSKTAETIFAELQPFKEHSDDFKMFIEALEAQPWWLEDVIKLVRGEIEEST